MTTGGCVPTGECNCMCHMPHNMGLQTKHIAPCCDKPPYTPPLEDPAWGDPLGLMWKDQTRMPEITEFISGWHRIQENSVWVTVSPRGIMHPVKIFSGEEDDLIACIRAARKFTKKIPKAKQRGKKHAYRV